MHRSARTGRPAPAPPCARANSSPCLLPRGLCLTLPQVVQETESGGEEVTGEDPLAAALRALGGAASAAMHGAEALVDRAYHGALQLRLQLEG